MRCDGEHGNFRKVAASDGTIGTDSTDVPGVIEAVGEKIDLQPTEPTKLSYPISGHYQLRVPENHSDTLSFFHPTVDVTVSVDCPDDFTVTIEGASIATPNMWQFGNRAFLTSEHVRLRWFKNKEIAKS
jgi:hypothetical protein